MKASFLLLLLLLNTATISNETQAANLQIQKCDTKECQYYFNEYKRKVREGYADAMETFASFYHVGYGTKVDLDKALKWYKRASKHRSTVGSYKAGLMYLTEDKIYDVERGLSYLRKASRAQHSESSYLLGIVHSQVEFGQLDYEEADKWLSLAFAAKHPKAIKYTAFLQYKKRLTQSNFPELSSLVESYELDEHKKKIIMASHENEIMNKQKPLVDEKILAVNSPLTPRKLETKVVPDTTGSEMEVIEVTSLTLADMFEADFVYFKTIIAEKRAMTTGTKIYRRSCSETLSCSEMPKEDFKRIIGTQ